MVYGIVYSPGEPDTDGEFATSEEIEQAAYADIEAAVAVADACEEPDIAGIEEGVYA